MDIKAQLKAEGLDDTEIAEIVKNEKALRAIEKFSARAELGDTTAQRAAAVAEELKAYQRDKLNPYVLQKDQEAAEAKGEAARLRTVLQSMKDAGYPITDASLTAAATPQPREVTPTYVSKDEFDKTGTDWAQAQMQLLDLSEDHRDLTGKGLRPKAEYDDFKTNGRPGETLRTYIARKYDHPTLAANKATAEKSEYENRLRAEGATAKAAELEAKYGANPMTRIPVASAWDGYKSDTTRKDSWKSEAGREASARDRMAKYGNNPKFLQ